ncbi:F0F1 ATP synthase subunit epsilon [Salinicola sp. MH3R3-1]|uniref:F0F1 ATP synthase subunit epsilon n=1 Tax=Salinicola sp. MH3R3-1 TaxID=1928762 RepID=UPI001FEE5093|nr:F0F1 ATP synthase subunit epsilon [Salinicola sp. MH3R3-1]
MPMMTLKVLLPYEVFVNEARVSRIVVETVHGSFGLLPQRLDCVAALVPGILVFTDDEQNEAFVALDAGVLVKTGLDVTISVRQALRGNDLACLHEAVKEQFITQDAQEESMRAAMAKLETGFMQRFAALQDRSP